MQKRKMQKVQKDHGAGKKEKKEKRLSSKNAATFLSAETLWDLLKQGQKPQRIDQILRIMGLKRRQKEDVEILLDELVARGKVLRLHGGQYVSSHQILIYVGRYSVQRSGVGFVDMARPEGGKPLPKSKHGSASKNKPDAALSIFVHPTQAGEAWHGDLVQVALLPGRGKKGSTPEGRIVGVVERKATELMVRVGGVAMRDKKHGHKSRPPRIKGSSQRRNALLHDTRYILATPCDIRFPISLRLDTKHIAAEILGEISPDCLILARPTEQISTNLWEAEVLSTHGREDDTAVQEELVKINHQAPSTFPEAALAEAELLPASPRPEDYAHREDLRSLPFVTIDGETAKDFDDAIFVEHVKNANNNFWKLQVAIADVTHYVPLQSALDKEAKLRGNSWYFPRSVEPMFPTKLSNGLCSLNPLEDRLVMVAEMHFASDGALHKSLFYPAVICSKARLTYTAVKELVLDANAEVRAAFIVQENGEKLLSMLTDAEALARILAQKRVQRGSLDFNRPEPEYYFDESGRIVNIGRKEQHFAHQLIEEFMIAANEAVAEFLEQQGVEHLYRVHPEPEEGRLQGLFETLTTTALAQSIPPHPKASDLQSILHAASGTDQEYILSRLTLRTMPQARYQPENTGHFGLASSCYCHFTSPIRRYADMVVHRALKATLRKSKDSTAYVEAFTEKAATPEGLKLQAIGDALNVCERTAMEAEREMARRLAVLVLQGHEGQEYEGIIGGVSDFGLFVELESMPVEGMVRISELGDDFFEYDPQKQELLGIMTGMRYALGQKVRVRLVEVNLGRLEITFSLIETYNITGSAQKTKHSLPRKQAAKLHKSKGRSRGGRESSRRRK